MLDFIVLDAAGHTLAECRELLDAVAVCERNREDGRATSLRHEPTGVLLYCETVNVTGAAMRRLAVERLEIALAEAEAKKARAKLALGALPVHPEYGRTCNAGHAVTVDGVPFRVYRKPRSAYAVFMPDDFSCWVDASGPLRHAGTGSPGPASVLLPKRFKLMEAAARAAMAAAKKGNTK